MNTSSPSRRAAMASLGSLLVAGPANAGGLGRITAPHEEIKAEGLRNFFRVDDKLYRAWQPKPAGYATLAGRFRVRTIVNLRDDRVDDADRPDRRLRLVNHPLATFDIASSEDQIIAALATIHRARGRVLVHCAYGKDRTGAVCALWHMLFMGWSLDRALADMIAGPFGFHEFLTLFPPGKSIQGYLARVDLDAMKRRVLARG